MGALEIPLIVKIRGRLPSGAKYVNPGANVLLDYVSGSNPFSDTTTAKEIAVSQNSKGADIIYHAAGGSGLGVSRRPRKAVSTRIAVIPTRISSTRTTLSRACSKGGYRGL